MTEFDRGRYEALTQLAHLMDSKAREVYRGADAMPRAGSLGNLSTIMARERALYHARGWEEAAAAVSAFMHQLLGETFTQHGANDDGSSREG